MSGALPILVLIPLLITMAALTVVAAVLVVGVLTLPFRTRCAWGDPNSRRA